MLIPISENDRTNSTDVEKLKTVKVLMVTCIIIMIVVRSKLSVNNLVINLNKIPLFDHKILFEHHASNDIPPIRTTGDNEFNLMLLRHCFLLTVLNLISHDNFYNELVFP